MTSTTNGTAERLMREFFMSEDFDPRGNLPKTIHDAIAFALAHSSALAAAAREGRDAKQARGASPAERREAQRPTLSPHSPDNSKGPE